MADTHSQTRKEFSALELERVLSLKEAAHITSTSIDTLRRNHADRIRKISARRYGMKLRDVISIGE